MAAPVRGPHRASDGRAYTRPSDGAARPITKEDWAQLAEVKARIKKAGESRAKWGPLPDGVAPAIPKKDRPPNTQEGSMAIAIDLEGVIEMREVEGMTWVEIARDLGVSQVTVYKRLKDAGHEPSEIQKGARSPSANDDPGDQLEDGGAEELEGGQDQDQDQDNDGSALENDAEEVLQELVEEARAGETWADGETAPRALRGGDLYPRLLELHNLILRAELGRGSLAEVEAACAELVKEVRP